MSEAVLDSSAVLAVILEQPGAERVEALLPGAKVSAVNVGEVAAKLRDLGMPEGTVETVLNGLQIVRAHDLDATLASGFLRPAAAELACHWVIACLTPAAGLGLPAVTADRTWQSVAEAIGVQEADPLILRRRFEGGRSVWPSPLPAGRRIFAGSRRW